MHLARSELQLESLFSRISSGELDLQPDFQRGEIWDRPRRQRLIDTLLRNWYVPAVHVVKMAEGDEVVLDGQQRLAAIRDFFQDGFPIDGNIQPISDELQKLHGKKFSALPEYMKRALRRFPLPIITLTDFDPDEPNELFFRLNQAYTLTPPEKRNALHGPARDAVKDLVTHLQDSGLLNQSAIGFSNGRLAYDDIIARTCVAVQNGTLAVHINNNIVEEFYREREFDSETIALVERAGLDLLGQIRRSPSRVRFNKGTLFTWLTYLVWAPLESAVPQDLLAEFEADRALMKRDGVEAYQGEERRIIECVAVYDDRGSYRVTDTSSVRLRDLAVMTRHVGRERATTRSDVVEE